jgi:hypothetical protein
MAKKKIYRKVFRFEVLSEEQIPDMDLEQIMEETTTGHMSGQFLDPEANNEVLEGEAAVKAVKDQGSSPDFFMMDEKGEELEEDL